jgi:hypothetical protein
MQTFVACICCFRARYSHSHYFRLVFGFGIVQFTRVSTSGRVNLLNLGGHKACASWSWGLELVLLVGPISFGIARIS